MPDQPADPLHYEMKIPPEPKENKKSAGRETQEEHRGSDEVTTESNDMERTGTSPEDARRHLPGGSAPGGSAH